MKLVRPRKPIPPLCPRCGYDLAPALAAQTPPQACSECGKPIDTAAPGGKRMNVFLQMPMGIASNTLVLPTVLMLGFIVIEIQAAIRTDDPRPVLRGLQSVYHHSPEFFIVFLLSLACLVYTIIMLRMRNGPFYNMPYKDRRILTHCLWLVPILHAVLFVGGFLILRLF